VLSSHQPPKTPLPQSETRFRHARHNGLSSREQVREVGPSSVKGRSLSSSDAIHPVNLPHKKPERQRKMMLKVD
jgi:hypothetical protein